MLYFEKVSSCCKCSQPLPSGRLIFNSHFCPTSLCTEIEKWAKVKQHKVTDWEVVGEMNASLYQEKPRQLLKEFIAVAKKEKRKEKDKNQVDTSRNCNLLPTETNVSSFKAIITMIVQIFGMNCCIPHHLRRRTKRAGFENLNFEKCTCKTFYYNNIIIISVKKKVPS